MKKDSHIPESRLLKAAELETHLDPLELRHMENCPACIDRLADLAAKRLRNMPNEKSGLRDSK